MNKEFFIRNRKNFMDKVLDNSIVILFAGNAPQKSGDENYNFTPNRNFYYLTGLDRENMIIILSKRNNKIEETLYIEENDPILAKWIGEKLSKAEVQNVSGVAEIEYISDFEARVHKYIDSNNYENLYLNLERMDYEDVLSRSHKFAKVITTKYPYIIIKNAFPLISDLRTYKTNEEIENMRTAIEITKDGVRNIMKNAKPGMMEYELQAYFDFTLKSRGVIDFAFNTIAASGKNATVLHYGENNCKTGDSDLILFDLGAQYEYYNSDISRTFPVSGKFTERQKLIYNIVLKAQEAVISIIKPGIPFVALNEKCKEVLAKGCIEIGLIKEASEISKYYFHGVSHYLGLDTHDVGSRELNLAPGMVVTVEPGLYIGEESIGIRIEDDVMVTDLGHEVLSNRFLTTVEEIEAFMKK